MGTPGWAWPLVISAFAVLGLAEYCPGSDVGVLLPGPGAKPIYAARSSFGLKVPQEQRQYALHISDPADACTPQTSPEDLAGKVALVRRGSCNYTDKAHTLAETNAAGMLVFNNEPGCLLIGGQDPIGHAFPLFALSISDQQGAQLLGAARNGHNATIWQPPPGAFDLSEVIIWALAVGTAVGGSLWAGADYQAELTWLSSSLAGGAGEAGSGGSSLEVLTVSSQTAVAFVCVASGMLLVMFFFLSKAFFYVLVAMFCLGSCQALAMACSSLFERMAGPKLRQHSTQLPLLGPVSTLTLAGAVPAVAVVVTWVSCQSTSWAWLLQDCLGMSLMALILRQFRLPSVQVASLLLLLCLAYDVFWVFIQPLFSDGTSVMVEVATGGEARWKMPMLILVPRITGVPGQSILGFGDVVLPGLLLVYARLVDLARGTRVLGGYFLPLSTGYGVGLLLAFSALYLHVGGDQGQPALLYLIPCTLGTLWVLAWTRGDSSLLWKRDVAAEALEHARKAHAPDRPDEEAGRQPRNRHEEASSLLARD